MKDVSIRHATIADAALLAELSARAFREAFADHPQNAPADIAAYMVEAFGTEIQARELAEPRATFLLAESAGEAVGYAKLLADSTETGVTGARPVELARLYALQAWIGRGIGAALMQSCLEEARNNGHDVIWLGVWEYNYRAQKFYARFGFVKCGEHIFQLGNDPQTDWLMQREI